MASSSRPQRESSQKTLLLERGTTDHYDDAELYDFEYRDRDEDVAWYERFVDERLHGTLPVLELGAGTGRVTLPLARRGHHVIALDRMPSMLDKLRDKLQANLEDPERDRVRERVRLLQGDMCELPLADATVGVVIAPFNALMHLYDWTRLLACFREVHRVLVPGGWFAFDVQMPDLEWLTWDPDERHATTWFRHPVTGERLVYSTNHTYDHATQICHVRIYYDEAPPRGRKFKPPPTPKKLVHLAHRQIFPEEIRSLTAQAGLVLERLTGDFEGAELRIGSESQVAMARRP